jgi:S1-C subfamily serine protease
MARHWFKLPGTEMELYSDQPAAEKSDHNYVHNSKLPPDCVEIAPDAKLKAGTDFWTQSPASKPLNVPDTCVLTKLYQKGQFLGWIYMEKSSVERLHMAAQTASPPSDGSDSSSTGIAQTRPESSGTGFFITEDGYLITNEHVAGNGAQVRLVTSAGLILAKVIKVDAANDLALLKAEGKFAVLPVAASRSMKLGGTVTTVGFPNIGLQGFAPKFARGEIASLSGPQDDARYFQISVPVQPGNSGGALVDEHGNVVGVVSGKLSAKATLSTSGSLPENVNYAVKSSFLLGFLESLPEVAAKLKDPNAKDMKFDDVVEQAKGAAVLVLVY